ncbi:uncharacterized protein BDR25DRAFT_359272 [Lindgomyces ingoldianus]|uniref:Uncharacterized protein n=1 Tax=Lindgomyces ingoldianus TaxID=673940 RepID=A0ACB6QJK6_9PLEO|nr:uncharacterized protein BDR25DRAFT_359272 [Lindgomyces ingoldianus]KAF2466763.1 hypothetical protein BDR25DRAFT_359272 [Lindgomyces ingoldianus]
MVSARGHFISHIQERTWVHRLWDEDARETREELHGGQKIYLSIFLPSPYLNKSLKAISHCIARLITSLSLLKTNDFLQSVSVSIRQFPNPLFHLGTLHYRTHTHLPTLPENPALFPLTTDMYDFQPVTQEPSLGGHLLSISVQGLTRVSDNDSIPTIS